MARKSIKGGAEAHQDLFNSSGVPGAVLSDAELFSFPVVRRRFRDEELLENLRDFARVFPADKRTMANYRAWPGRRFHDHTIIAQLGGWLAALKRVGATHTARSARGPSKNEIEANLRQFAKAKPLPARTLANFKAWRSRKVSVFSITKHFGNWHSAFKALGIEVPGQSKSQRHSDEELLAAIERLWRWCRRPPSTEDFKKYARSHDDGISSGTVYHRFGPVKPFLAAFADWKRGKISKAQLLSWGRGRRARRQAIPIRLRYRILRAHNFTCAKCGRSPQNNPNTMLEVDHIIPVSQGGANAEDNLQVLCFKCNRGKVNHYSD